MSLKLVGFRLSPTVEEILHISEIVGANLILENVDWRFEGDNSKHSSQTLTLPYLVTPQGTISESKAIEYYLASKRPDLVGKNVFEKAQVRQWFEFSEEFNICGQELYYPIFGWKEYNKERANFAEERVGIFFQALDSQLSSNKFVCGNKITIADVSLFRAIKYYFQLLYPEGKRQNSFKSVNEWFSRMMATKEVQKVYGPFTLCKVPVKPCLCPIQIRKDICQNKTECPKKCTKAKECISKTSGNPMATPDNDQETKIKKAKVALDALPPSKLELESFKREFLNNKDKNDRIKKFWEIFDPKGYCIYYLQYQNLPTDGKVLYLTKNAMSFFIQKSDPVRKYVFGSMGVYGCEGDYKIRGVWMFRGSEIPELMNQNDLFEWYDKVKLDPNNEKDRKKIEEYWSKIEEGEEVEERPVASFTYVH